MLLLRGATDSKQLTRKANQFQYMLLLRGATCPCSRRAGKRPFQYMLLLRGATCRCGAGSADSSFNTCSSCEEQQDTHGFDEAFEVSIHAPLARSNLTSMCMWCSGRSVSIHAPLARSNASPADPVRVPPRFNTCSSCEEQQGRCSAIFWRRTFQYMLLLRGATDVPPVLDNHLLVSIHAPLARSNGDGAGVSALRGGFNTCSSCEEQQVRGFPARAKC